MIVHQMGSVLSLGDAVTNHIFEIDRRLRGWGFTTRVYGADIANAPGHQAKRDSAYQGYLDNPDDLLLYHYSAYCDNYRLFQRSRNRKVVIYHNITPAEYFRPYDARYESICSRGRALLGELTQCDLALGVSEYNRAELVKAGFAAERTGVLPLFLGESDFTATVRDPQRYRKLTIAGKTTLLFVGKVAPNKAFEDLIKIFSAYFHHVNPQSQLILVGARFLPVYDAMLERLVVRLGLEDAVIFTNRLRLPELRSCYEAADLFLCGSKHEGFCAPLLEAMYFDVPILARACAATPETLGDAGIQYAQLAYPQLAELIHQMVTDSSLRERIVKTQRQRLKAFDQDQVEEQLSQMLARLGVPVQTGALTQ